tara:strand:- start:1809 stop:1940 length:132 start_codon:yes stop_codon:yes gene_type:complete
MTKPNESDTIARMCVGLIVFLAIRLAPKAVEWWQKRNEKGEMQ